jgi:nucleoside-diphosphate-sugar epimerase
MALVERDARGAMNFGTGKATTVCALIGMICERFGRPALWEMHAKEVGEIDFQVLDATRAAVELEWQPKVTLEDGLNETVDWYREYFGK